jgi:hypothetical protein
MSIKKILIPAFVLGSAYLAACGASVAPIGDMASGGSAGSGDSAGGATAKGGSKGVSGSTGVSGGGGSGGSSTTTPTGGTSNGGGGGQCGIVACPDIACLPGETPEATSGSCCPVCMPSGGGSGGVSGVAGSASGGSGGQDCSKPHVCPGALTQCAPGEPETPVGECCQVCVSTGGSGGA